MDAVGVHGHGGHTVIRWIDGPDNPCASLRNQPSSWEVSYRRPDAQLIVERDKPQFGSRIGRWADYGTVLAREPRPT